MTVYSAVLTIVSVLATMVVAAWFLVAFSYGDAHMMILTAIIEACICVVTISGIKGERK